MRDIHAIPPSRMRKRELRALVVEMRLRHEDEIGKLLALLPPEASLRWCHERVRARAPLNAVYADGSYVHPGYMGQTHPAPILPADDSASGKGVAQ